MDPKKRLALILYREVEKELTHTNNFYFQNVNYMVTFIYLHICKLSLLWYFLKNRDKATVYGPAAVK